MRKVYSASNLVQAHLALDLLVQAGIEARLFNEYAQGGLGEIPFTHAYPEVWVVEDSDWERARSVLQDYESTSTGANQQQACPACSEPNPSAFEVCWRCGAALD